ncbi:MAG: sodium:calcium antiporter [Planctomycetes bacterium]|nr:sodium:calcium antiporter [Planctomycetota bacterium]MCB9884530.1 sodium:calcium antiporter [Planctomycetota bacterium]
MPAALLPLAWTTDYPIAAILVGLVGLVAGADLLVRGSVWIALTLGMSRMAVGLTLVAMGTSLPELLVSFTAARSGNSEIAMANVIGSNTANVLLIVGCAASICAIRLQVRWYELVYMSIATALAAVPFLFTREVSRPLSTVMVVMLAMFCFGLLRRERTHEEHPGHEAPPRATLFGWLLHLALLGGGFVLLAYSAEWLVDGAVAIASSLGMSKAVIGMTIVAIGTSLPELATSAVAAKKGQPEIAIGNVIGSNIFNVGSVLGVAGLLQPFPVDVDELGRLMVMTGASAVLLVFVLRALGGVPRFVGVLFLLIYAGFMAYEVMHGKVS